MSLCLSESSQIVFLKHFLCNSCASQKRPPCLSTHLTSHQKPTHINSVWDSTSSQVSSSSVPDGLSPSCLLPLAHTCFSSNITGLLKAVSVKIKKKKNQYVFSSLWARLRGSESQFYQGLIHNDIHRHKDKSTTHRKAGALYLNKQIEKFRPLNSFTIKFINRHFLQEDGHLYQWQWWDVGEVTYSSLKVSKEDSRAPRGCRCWTCWRQNDQSYIVVVQLFFFGWAAM